MTERYWEAGKSPDAMLDWVSQNVADAIRYFWEEDPPVAWIEDDLEEHGGRLVLTVGGPEKPDDEGDIYSLSVDLLSELSSWSVPYGGIGDPPSEEQRQDMKERAAALRSFARAIVELADAADLVANAALSGKPAASSVPTK